MPASRPERLAHELQQEIAQIIHRELKDPRLGFVTITRVELSKDLAYAKVLFSCLGTPEECLQSQEVLEHSATFVRGLIKKRFRLKIIPRIQFRYDASIAGSIAITQTLNELKEPPQGTPAG